MRVAIEIGGDFGLILNEIRFCDENECIYFFVGAN